MSKFFSSTTNRPSYDVVADPYKNVRESTTGWLTSQVGKPAEQYSGQIVAPMSEQETQSLDWLKNYVNAGNSDLTTAGQKEIKDTLSGDTYDPTKSGYYQAVKAEAARNLADTQRDIVDQSAGGGNYWTGARLGEQAKASSDSALAMNKLLYGMAETERGNRLNAATTADQMGREEENQALNKASALQTLGALPRSIAQATNEAAYNEWLRATQEYPLQIASLASGLSREPYYAQTTKTPSQFSQLMSKASMGLYSPQ